MGLNRLMMGKKPSSSGGGTTGDNTFTVTVGKQGYQYGFSRYNATIGEVEGNVQHEGKAVTLVMLCYYSGFLDFAFNIEGVSSGKYNVTVKVTSVDTGTSGTIEFPNMQYQSYIPGFYEYTQSLTSDIILMFSQANVGKKIKVEIVFN
ncbi:hypothetical protein [Phascolarctobacterium succinatutens]|uniref:hypothetical protein n=1 Tax=Phascolarctobacterium succinatutens TaxID=626940 RepID=UPI00307836C4